ncbi:MAG: hypothetical protein FWG81_06260 [Betaproteobacteria bacterium]|nr:hypothetical protein [Betaproteobacteria bacterium]
MYIKTTGQLQLNTLLNFCCNCGARGSIDKGEIELIETPLVKTSYFIVFGSELELLETFPYCRRCKSSARRVRPGLVAKLIAAFAVIAAVFLWFVLIPDSLPRVMQTNLFAWSVFVGAAITFGYFYLRGLQRAYYQPVSLIDADTGEYQLRLHLKFTNASYARLFSQANAELVAARVLKVESAG